MVERSILLLLILRLGRAGYKEKSRLWIKVIYVHEILAMLSFIDNE